MQGIKDKVIIVTGAGRNIGQVYSRRLAEEGAKVVVCDVIDCEETAGIVRAAGAEVLPLHVDVTDEAQTQEMARRAAEHFGRIDGLVNNAALFQDLRSDENKGFMDIDMDRWDSVYSVNVRGTFLCMRAVFPYMRDGGGGKIINIGSGTFLHSSRGRMATNPHYVSSKAAVMGLTRAVAKEMGQYNIKVNTLSPGGTDTTLNAESVQPFKEETDRALNRPETPDDLTGTVVFLLSPESDFITGQMIVVNGGMETY
ncbi:MAG: SDR family oxidoreductase [Chloroflexi bacterium]|nr:SDR family oxidoreductase [Chloroflexota bacterium]